MRNKRIPEKQIHVFLKGIRAVFLSAALFLLAVFILPALFWLLEVYAFGSYGKVSAQNESFVRLAPDSRQDSSAQTPKEKNNYIEKKADKTGKKAVSARKAQKETAAVTTKTDLTHKSNGFGKSALEGNDSESEAEPEIELILEEGEERKDSEGICHYTTDALKKGSLVFKETGEDGNLKKTVVLLTIDQEEGNAEQTFMDIYEDSSFTEQEKMEKTVKRPLSQIISGTEKAGDGKWSLYAYVEDTEGNKAGSLEEPIRTVVVDDAPPELRIQEGEPSCDDPASDRFEDKSTGKIYYKADVTVFAVLSDDSEGHAMEPDLGHLKWSVSSGTQVDLKTEGGDRDPAGLGSLITCSEGSASALPDVTFTAEDLAGNRGSAVFINSKENEKYYFDRELPSISWLDEENEAGINFQKGDSSACYRFYIRDGETGSGIDRSMLRYAVVPMREDGGTQEPEEGDWIVPDNRVLSVSGDTYSFTIRGPAGGRIWVRAEDRIGNRPVMEKANVLIMEQDKPVMNSLTVKTVKDGEEGEAETFYASGKMPSAAQNYSFHLNAGDEPADAVMFSGLRFVHYQLKEEGERIPLVDSYGLFNESVISEPAEPEELIKEGNSGDFTLPRVPDGEYTLKVWAEDFCGNKSDPAAVSLIIDNTAPVIDVEMEGGALASEGYAAYYRDNNCGIRVTVLEKNIKSCLIRAGSLTLTQDQLSEQGKWTVSDYLADGKAVGKIIYIEPGALVGEKDKRVNEDGKISVSVSVTDEAGAVTTHLRRAENMETESVSGRIVSAAFILDTEAPRLDEMKILTDGEAAGEEDPRVSKIFDGTCYFNDKSVSVKFHIAEENPAKFYTGSRGKKTVKEKAGIATILVTMTGEGVYDSIFIRGQDKAGNRLVPGEGVLKGPYRCLAAVYDGIDKIQLEHSFIIDRTAPTAEIRYSSKGKAYLYEDSGGTGLPARTAYVNKAVTATITVRDRFGDAASVLNGSDVVVHQYAKVGSERGYTVSDPGSWTEKDCAASFLAKAVTGSEGYYYFTVRAADRAGNALVQGEEGNQGPENPASLAGGSIRELISSEFEDMGENVLPRTGVFERDDDGGFRSAFMIVYDKTSPSASFSYRLDKGENRVWLYRECLAGTGNDRPVVTAYFSGTAVPVLQVEEKNPLDVRRLYASQFRGENAPGKEERKLFADPRELSGSLIWTAQDISPLSRNGTWAYYSVSGTDRAGNPVRMEEDAFEAKDRVEDAQKKGLRGKASSDGGGRLKKAEGSYTSSYLLVIDKESPLIDLSYIPSENSRAYVYTDKNGDGTRGMTPLYAFVRDKMSVQASIINDNEHIDPKRLFYADVDTGLERGSKKTWADKKYRDQTPASREPISLKSACSNEADGFRYKVFGVDKAGNAARVSESIRTGAVIPDSQKDRGLKRGDLSCKNVESKSDYAPLYTIIYDDKAPVLTMQYMPVPAEDRRSVYAFVYDEEGVKKAYISGNNEVSVRLDESFYDLSRLGYMQTRDGENTLRPGKKPDWDGRSGAWAKDSMTLTLDTAVTDGIYTWSVYGVDRAGNTATVVEKFDEEQVKKGLLVSQNGADAASSFSDQNQGKSFLPHYTIVIDKTAPEVTDMVTLAGVRSKETAVHDGQAASPRYYRDDKTFYYNTKKGIRTVYTLAEHNFDPKRMSGSWILEGTPAGIPMAWEEKDEKSPGDEHIFTLSFPNDGTYENVRMAGTDKAGNHLVLKGFSRKEGSALGLQNDWQSSESYDVSRNNDTPAMQSAALLVMKGRTSPGGVQIKDRYGYTDTEVMLARRRILDRTCPEAVITHVIPDDTTAYLYPHEDGDDAGNTAALYSKNVVTTTVSVSDSYGSGRAAKAVLADGEKIRVQRVFREAGGRYTASDIESWARYPDSTDPLVTVVKTEAEGRWAFTVGGRDRAGNPVHVTEKIRTNKEKGAVVDKKKGGYSGRVKNEESTKSGGTYRSFFVLVYDATAPVYRFTINNPDKLEDTFDNTKGKQIVYYGASLPMIKGARKIYAEYVVRDINFDRTRILSAVTGLSARDKGKRVDDVDGLWPDWITPTQKCEEIIVKDGIAAASFPMPLDVDDRMEGVYRFEISGSDKAGNLLVRSREQEKADSSTEIEDLAVRTVDNKKGTGRYWTERKVIDVTAPTGSFRVRRNEGEKKDYYRIRFSEGGNIPEIYDPFHRETGACVTVESDDQSPVSISYDLRSKDKSLDSLYKGKNPLVSGGSKGYANDNSCEMAVSGEQAFYIEHLVMKDRAGNIRANDEKSDYTLERSNNIYLDISTPDVSEIKDAEAPQIKISVDKGFTRHESDGERYIYRPDGPALDLKVSITDPGGEERSSGLKKVTAEVTVGSKAVTEKVGLSGIPFTYSWRGEKGKENDPCPALVYEISDGMIRIPAGSFAESNDITVRVEAEDNSGNRSVASKDGGLLKLGIDTTAPRVEVNYHDTAEAENEKYFKADRIVDVVVIDRNVEDSRINIRTNIGIPASFSEPHSNRSSDGEGETGNEDRWIKTLTYNMDGDYTLQISGSDALGNNISDIKWNGPAPNEFTIDKTPPRISIILPDTEKNLAEGTKYYDQAVTAAIRIEEHNFREDDRVRIKLDFENRGDDPKVEGLSRTKFISRVTDVHESRIKYSRDGDYEIRAAYTDMAGNAAVVEGGNTTAFDGVGGRQDGSWAWSGKFVVDLTDPVLEIDPSTFNVDPKTGKPEKGLENQVYTDREFAPLVHMKDTNCDMADSVLEVRAVGSDTNRATYRIKNQTAYSFDIEFDSFKVVKEMDGVYFVRAVAADLAGRTSTLEFMFSVNRFGSSYAYADDPTEEKVNRYYIRSTDDPVRILEISPADLKTHEIELFKDHERRKLKEGKEYTFAPVDFMTRSAEKKRIGGQGGRIYEYTVDPAVFCEEGVYDFIISSKDIAGNENSTSVYRDGRTKGDEIELTKFPIEFQVDRTVPVNRITGVESGETRFRQDRLEITVFPEDYQTDICEVEIRIFTGSERGTDAVEDVSKYQHYRPISKEEDAVKLAIEHIYPIEDAGRGIPVILEGKNGLRSWQFLEIITTDLAGNTSTDYRTGDNIVKIPETRRKFLVSTNLMIQYYYNRPLFFGSLGAMFVLILLFMIWRYKGSYFTGFFEKSAHQGRTK